MMKPLTLPWRMSQSNPSANQWTGFYIGTSVTKGLPILAKNHIRNGWSVLNRRLSYHTCFIKRTQCIHPSVIICECDRWYNSQLTTGTFALFPCKSKTYSVLHTLSEKKNLFQRICEELKVGSADHYDS